MGLRNGQNPLGFLAAIATSAHTQFDFLLDDTLDMFKLKLKIFQHCLGLIRQVDFHQVHSSK